MTTRLDPINFDFNDMETPYFMEIAFMDIARINASAAEVSCAKRISWPSVRRSFSAAYLIQALSTERRIGGLRDSYL
jgi:hypothetical protein